MKFVLGRLVDLVADVAASVKFAAEDIVDHVKASFQKDSWEDDFKVNQFDVDDVESAEEAPKKKKKKKKKSKK